MTTLLVRDYDEALDYFVGLLGFVVREGTIVSSSKRWVVIEMPGGGGALLLARAANERQQSAIGRQSGGRVFLFLKTDDFERDHANFLEKGIRFLEAPRREPYGIVAVFEDLYGNRWDLIGHRRS